MSMTSSNFAIFQLKPKRKNKSFISLMLNIFIHCSIYLLTTTSTMTQDRLNSYLREWLPGAVSPPAGGQRHRLEEAALYGEFLASPHSHTERQTSAASLSDIALYAHLSV